MPRALRWMADTSPMNTRSGKPERLSHRMFTGKDCAVNRWPVISSSAALIAADLLLLGLSAGVVILSLKTFLRRDTILAS